ncbi:MAG TPA: tetratricopeptide repeat protein [Candidatus Acidoferrales bacterium]|nr:tetratricopeptide repeat protein [Candidatus Acidoferrales bacterium]
MDEKPDGFRFSRSREAVLASCFALLIGMFGVTAFVTRTYHKRTHQLADQWHEEGETALAAQRPEEAVTDFRNALVYSPNNSVFQFHLTQALIAAHHWNDAEEYLQNLLSETPGSGEINLSLARIAAEENSMVNALRYYQAAIYGSWEQNPIEMRWQTRYELCEYLLSHNAMNQAEAEVIALADNTAPGDRVNLLAAAKLLMQARLWTRALDEFNLVLEIDHHDAEALAGAGTAEFQMGHYEPVIDYFARLPKEKRSEPGIMAMMGEAQEVEAFSPRVAGLAVRAKARRTSAAVGAAEERVAACSQSLGQPIDSTSATTELQKIYAEAEAKKREWSAIRLELHPDQMADALNAALEMEDAATKRCGEPKSGIDRVLRLIAQQGENPRQ